jgi:hypothetical protein
MENASSSREYLLYGYLVHLAHAAAVYRDAETNLSQLNSEHHLTILDGIVVIARWIFRRDPHDPALGRLNKAIDKVSRAEMQLSRSITDILALSPSAFQQYLDTLGREYFQSGRRSDFTFPPAQ